MAIYVDNAKHPFGRMLMSHMMADTTEELVAMGLKIGLHAKWLQHVGIYKEHFDVCQTKRAEAIKLGAVEVTPRFLGELMRKRRQ